MADINEKGVQLEQILKLSLEECINLARKKIRTKKGLTDLQSVLVDYHQNTELASIILNVVRLISLYQSNKQDQSEEQKQTVSIQEYNSLEQTLQKYQSSVREHIRVEQELKIYCDQIEQKNKDLQTSNTELLKSTKQMITSLKRQNQKLMYRRNDRDHNNRQEIKDQAVINSNRKPRKTGESPSIATGREDNNSNWQEESVKNRKNSLSAMRSIK